MTDSALPCQGFFCKRFLPVAVGLFSPLSSGNVVGALPETELVSLLGLCLGGCRVSGAPVRLSSIAPSRTCAPWHHLTHGLRGVVRRTERAQPSGGGGRQTPLPAGWGHALPRLPLAPRMGRLGSGAQTTGEFEAGGGAADQRAPLPGGRRDPGRAPAHPRRLTLSENMPRWSRRAKLSNVCTIGKPCGNTCIAVSDTCSIGGSSGGSNTHVTRAGWIAAGSLFALGVGLLVAALVAPKRLKPRRVACGPGGCSLTLRF